MQHSPCYCGESEYRTLFVSGQYRVAECRRCRQVRTITPGSVKRKQEYAENDLAVYVEKEVMFRGLFRNVIAFVRRWRARGVFLEIGAGVGLLVDEARRAGYEAYGLEPSKSEVRVAKQRFGVSLINAEFSPDTWKTQADVVVLNHVLEHIPDPKAVLAHIRRVLNPDGVVIIGVPNFGSVLARFKKSRWQSLIPDQHRWHFTKNTLDTLLTSNGFRRVGITSESHDRSMHPAWKRPGYAVLDIISGMLANGEAILVSYRKTP